MVAGLGAPGIVGALPVANPTPTIDFIDPSSGTAGSFVVVNVFGSGFVPGSAVYVGTNVVSSNYESPTILGAAFLAPTTPGPVAVTVVNPAPGGGTSNAVTFTVTAPMPTINYLVPASGTAGSSVDVNVIGTGFVPTSVVFFGATMVPTAYLDPFELIAFFTAPNTPGPVAVTVVNPAPGGGTSNAVTFTVVAGPAARITPTAGTPQSATVRTAFSAALQATVTDQ
ncbi:MAG: IPT/TIG domain-containing protein, partial [Chloroflexota bacterium]|nr:IPT/TIG domain-containing protein [Chloroflexota bacterium]